MPNRTSRYYELPRDVRLASSAWCLARAPPHKQQPPHASRAKEPLVSWPEAPARARVLGQNC